MTAILQLPLLEVTFETATNEGWRDSFAFVTAGQAVGYPSPKNVGNGALADLAVEPGAYVGDYVITLATPTTYRVSDPDGYVLGAGILDVPFSRSGLTLTVQAGSVPFAVGDTLIASVVPTPIDLTGIDFHMQVRAATDRATVDLDLSTGAGTIVNGGLSGVLGLVVPQPAMARVTPGSLVCDVLALADGETRRCITGTITHALGVTQPPT